MTFPAKCAFRSRIGRPSAVARAHEVASATSRTRDAATNRVVWSTSGYGIGLVGSGVVWHFTGKGARFALSAFAPSEKTFD